MLPVLSLCDSNVFESTIFETKSEKDMLMSLDKIIRDYVTGPYIHSITTLGEHFLDRGHMS